MDKLRGIKGIATVELERGDIVRHRLVQNIVNAYERARDYDLMLFSRRRGARRREIRKNRPDSGSRLAAEISADGSLRRSGWQRVFAWQRSAVMMHCGEMWCLPSRGNSRRTDIVSRVPFRYHRPGRA